MENRHIRLEDILPQKRLLVRRENLDPSLCRGKPYIHSREIDGKDTSSIASKLKLGRIGG
jgi:hypothetical protein